MLKSVIGAIFFFFMLALIGVPMALVVVFPESGKDVASIAGTMIPWLVILVVVLVFSEGLKNFLSSLAGAIARIRKVSAGGTTAELRQESGFTKSQLETLEEERQTESKWAWHFFFKYIAATIYGSQVSALEALGRDGPKQSDELVYFYNIFVSRREGNSAYPFESWVDYMTSNFLMEFKERDGSYYISEHGRAFVDGIKSIGYEWDHFPS